MLNDPIGRWRRRLEVTLGQSSFIKSPAIGEKHWLILNDGDTVIRQLDMKCVLAILASHSKLGVVLQPNL